MKLSELIKGLPAGIAFHAEKFDVNGKAVVKYTEDFTNTDKVNGKGKTITKANDAATYVPAKETEQLTVPNEVLAALRLDKAEYATRRWYVKDLSVEQLTDIRTARGKMLFLRLSLALQDVNDRVRKGCVNKGVLMLDTDINTFSDKLDSCKEQVDAMLIGGVEEEADLEEDY